MATSGDNLAVDDPGRRYATDTGAPVPMVKGTATEAGVPKPNRIRTGIERQERVYPPLVPEVKLPEKKTDFLVAPAGATAALAQLPRRK